MRDTVIDAKTHMKGWVAALIGFEDTEGDMDELAHHGAQDDHVYLAKGSQSVSEGTAPVSPCESHHGWHVEGFSQKGMSPTLERRVLPLTLEPDSHWRGFNPAKAAACRAVLKRRCSSQNYKTFAPINLEDPR
jgi:hypothetical protein